MLAQILKNSVEKILCSVKARKREAHCKTSLTRRTDQKAILAIHGVADRRDASFSFTRFQGSDNRAKRCSMA